MPRPSLWRGARRGSPALRAAALAALLACAGVAAGNPLPDIVITAHSSAPAEVSVFTVPDGSGRPLTQAMLLGGEAVDATIVVHLYAYNVPIAGFPREDIWLVTDQGGLTACPGGTIADHATDSNGRTTFTQALRAGGASQTQLGERTLVELAGYAFSNEVLPPMRFNSPDINRDRQVNLTDIVLFANDYSGAYQYRSDFAWDGVLNLSDIVLMAQSIGRTCP